MFQFFEWYSKDDGSLWRQLAEMAYELKRIGTTAIWFPPPYKGHAGAHDVGYGVYDMYDLGEFDQKGSVRTRYGTKDEFLNAVKEVQKNGIHAYIDVVFNHRMGGDETEEVEIVEINQDDRNIVDSPPYKIKAWSHYKFPGRDKRYSNFEWHWYHFTAFGANANAPDEHKIYRVKDKGFSGEVNFDHGNFDYLMGADVDVYNPEVRENLFHWGRWIIDMTSAQGFRLDAVKHIPASFFRDWLKHVRSCFPGREIFAVGEYWSASRDELKQYLHVTEGVMRLFDVPLHYKFTEASVKGREFDLSKIFEGSLLETDPLMAVTFVDNHDTQPGQALQSTVHDWFKPLAYALILLRRDGYPCIFYGDYFGNEDPEHMLQSHRTSIATLLSAREKYTFGDQHDYIDHPSCIGWVWSGDQHSGTSMAVIMSNGDDGMKKMKTYHGHKTYRDITGNWPEPIDTDENGEAEFRCAGGKVSVWAAG